MDTHKEVFDLHPDVVFRLKQTGEGASQLNVKQKIKNIFMIKQKMTISSSESF